jgi:Tol biopolymer transport system component
MAPEQVEGRDADARTDIFALGAVIYEIATGRRRFDGGTPASVISAILKDTPPPVSRLQPLAPPALDHLVNVCLAKDPDERWQSAADVRRELTWIASNLSAPGAVPAAARPSKRISLVQWLSTAVLLIALVIALPLALRQWSSSSPEPAVVRFTIFPPENTTFAATGASVPSTQLAVSPDGRRLAFVAAPPGGHPALWLRAFDTMQPQMLAGTEDASYPFWSPDSRFIGFFAQGKLKKVDITGGTPQGLCDMAGDPRGGAWSREGVIVFGPTTSSGLFQVTAAGGVPAPLTSLGEGESGHRWPSFLPDGRHFVFFIRAREQRGVYLGSLDSQATTRLLSGDARFNAIYAPPGYLLTVHNGALLAHPFDEKSMQIVGDPVRVADQVAGSSTQLASFSASANGVLAYSSGLTTLSRLEWFDRQGKALGAATEVGDYVNFRLSPDDRRVAVSRADPQTNTSELWLLELARGVLTRFTFDAANDTAPVWSPDGKRVFFRSDRAGGNYPFEKPSTGAEPERQVSSGFEAVFPTDWSPDGKFIVYHTGSSKTASYDVMVLPRSGGAGPEPFAQSTFIEIDGHFSPDQRWLAYASDESGRMEVYVQPFPRSGSRWQVSTGGGSEPHWRRDGKELFYLAPDRKIMAVTVRAASTFESDAPRPLFQTRAPFPGTIYRMNYDVTGDGTRFLVNTLVEGASSSPIYVVVNWPAALKK